MASSLSNILHGGLVKFRVMLRATRASQALRAGDNFASQGLLTDSLAAYGKAISITESMLRLMDPKSKRAFVVRYGMAIMHNNCGVTLQSLGRMESALSAYRQAVDLMTGVLADLDQNNSMAINLRHDLAMTMSNCGVSLESLGKWAEAICFHDEAISVLGGMEALVESGAESYLPLVSHLLRAHINRGTVLRSQGSINSAKMAFDRAIYFGEVLRAALPQRSWSFEARNDLARAYHCKAAMLLMENRHSEALLVLEKAIRLMESLRAWTEASGRWSPEMRHDLCQVYTLSGVASQQQGQIEESITAYGRAIEIMGGLRVAVESVGNWTPELRLALAAAHANRCSALIAYARPMEAIRSFTEANELYSA